MDSHKRRNLCAINLLCEADFASHNMIIEVHTINKHNQSKRAVKGWYKICQTNRYAELQRIKQSNGNQENKELDYSIKLAVAKLSSLGVNVEDITL